MELLEVVTDIATGLSALDAAGSRFREFQPGVGPFGEPQLVREIAAYLNTLTKYRESAKTKRCPDLLIPNEWAIEVKSQGRSATMAKKRKTGRSTSYTPIEVTQVQSVTATSS